MRRMDTTKLLSEQIKGLRASIDSMPEDAPLKPACASFLDDAVVVLAKLQQAYPQAHEQTETLALYLASLATCLAGHYSTQVQCLEEEKSRRAELTNEKARLVAEVACAIAANLWEFDKSNQQEYRITEMSKVVRAELDRRGFVKKGTDSKEGRPTLRTIKSWITAVAPDYARAHGAEKAESA